jgi:hypothetical protein
MKKDIDIVSLAYIEIYSDGDNIFGTKNHLLFSNTHLQSRSNYMRAKYITLMVRSLLFILYVLKQTKVLFEHCVMKNYIRETFHLLDYNDYIMFLV